MHSLSRSNLSHKKLHLRDFLDQSGGQMGARAPTNSLVGHYSAAAERGHTCSEISLKELYLRDCLGRWTVGLPLAKARADEISFVGPCCARRYKPQCYGSRMDRNIS